MLFTCSGCRTDNIYKDLKKDLHNLKNLKTDLKDLKKRLQNSRRTLDIITSPAEDDDPQLNEDPREELYPTNEEPPNRSGCKDDLHGSHRCNWEAQPSCYSQATNMVNIFIPLPRVKTDAYTAQIWDYTSPENFYNTSKKESPD